MTNHELKRIVDEILRNEPYNLATLAEKARVGRSNLNSKLKAKKAVVMRPDTVNKIRRAFPKYFAAEEQSTIRKNTENHIAPEPHSSEIERLEREVAFYRREVLTSLDKVYRNVTYSRAEIRGSIEYQAIKDARGNEDTRKGIMAQINKLIELNLIGDVVVGNSFGAGKENNS